MLFETDLAVHVASSVRRMISERGRRTAKLRAAVQGFCCTRRSAYATASRARSVALVRYSSMAARMSRILPCSLDGMSWTVLGASFI
jgi:hypothetical protein